MKAVAEEATTRRVTTAFFAEHDLDDLRRRNEHWLGQQGRLTEPMWKRSGATHYEAVSWAEAIDVLANRLKACSSPDRATFYTSGRTSNEAAFAYQLLVRAYGTNNLPDCSNLCHESTSVALGDTIGVGKGTVSLDDVEHAELIIVCGQNPGTNHPRMLSSLEAAKRRGARIIAVNPLPEAGLLRFKDPQRPRGVVGHGTALADLFLQIRVNGDLALFQALNHLLIARHDAGEPVVDRGFVDESTEGFEAFAATARDLDWGAVDRATGLPRAAIEAAAAMVAGVDRIVVCWAMGLTQHRNAVATIREVVNLLLLRGAIGLPGAGLCPVRGHSNVQGDRTMGIFEQPTPAFLDALESRFGFAPPREPGFDVVESIRAMERGEVDVLVAMGGNFVGAAPDTARTEAALASVGLTVHVSTKLNRSHVVTGDEALILPCLGRTEVDEQVGGRQRITVEDSMSMVHASSGGLTPAAPDLRSEVAIVCAIGAALLGPTTPVDWAGLAGDYRVIRSHIEAVIPGFERFEERIDARGGFALHHPVRDERRFPTSSGKARFTVNDLVVLDVPAGRLLMQTLRSHDQYNTTIYGLDDRYRGVRHGREVVFVHLDDLMALGFADGDIVDVVSEHDGREVGRITGFRLVAYPTALGCCAAYFPEANALVALDSVADRSGTPTSKSIIVHFEARGR